MTKPGSERFDATLALLSLLLPHRQHMLILIVRFTDRWHMQNKTTVEHHEGVTAHEFYRRQGQAFRHPYDVGTLENVRQVLGHGCASWLIPGIAAGGDGLRFPHNLARRTREHAWQSTPGAAAGAGQLIDRKRDVYANLLT